MKAIRNPIYGQPDTSGVIVLEDVEKPSPAADEVLVQVYASTANTHDWRRVVPDPAFLVKVDEGFSAPKNPQLGSDLAGVVTAVGSNVTDFKVGDRVFGNLFDEKLGAFAEYAAVPQQYLTHLPENVSYEVAATAPMAGLTALQGLRDIAQVKAGDKVLINGASGGVGSYGVQIAKALGAADVTGVCSTRNVDYVRSLGADNVIDYTQQDVTQNDERYDAILDVVGNLSVFGTKRILKTGGRAAVVGFYTLPRMFGLLLIGGVVSRFSDVMMKNHLVKINQADLAWLGEHLANGNLTPHIAERFPLEQTATALAQMTSKRTVGKLVITINQPSE